MSKPSTPPPTTNTVRAILDNLLRDSLAASAFPEFVDQAEQAINQHVISELEKLKDATKQYVRETPKVHADEVPFYIAGYIAAMKLKGNTK